MRVLSPSGFTSEMVCAMMAFIYRGEAATKPQIRIRGEKVSERLQKAIQRLFSLLGAAAWRFQSLRIYSDDSRLKVSLAEIYEK